jgi:hypothetical protein
LKHPFELPYNCCTCTQFAPTGVKDSCHCYAGKVRGARSYTAVCCSCVCVACVVSLVVGCLWGYLLCVGLHVLAAVFGVRVVARVKW